MPISQAYSSSSGGAAWPGVPGVNLGGQPRPGQEVIPRQFKRRKNFVMHGGAWTDRRHGRNSDVDGEIKKFDLLWCPFEKNSAVIFYHFLRTFVSPLYITISTVASVCPSRGAGGGGVTKFFFRLNRLGIIPWPPGLTPKVDPGCAPGTRPLRRS